MKRCYVVSVPLILVIGLGLGYAWIQAARDRSLRTCCHANFCFIDKAMRMYAMDHSGSHATDISSLTNYLWTSHNYTCPTIKTPVGGITNVATWSNYIYLFGLTESDPSSCVQAFCPPGAHKGRGANVLFLNGSVAWLTIDEFVALTNNPSSFFGTSNPEKLADLQKRTHLATGHNFELSPNKALESPF
jgi:hypothetical protein